VLFDQHKGRKPIDFFDYKNIVGRSGRMKMHFVGKVFEFNPEPIQSELDVEVPLFDQKNAPLELLVQLDREDVQESAEKRLNSFDALDEELQAVIKRNAGIPVDGQIAFVRELKSALSAYHAALSWSTIPSYQELSSVLELCWRFLMKASESKAGVRSPKQLAVATLQYCAGKSLRALIVQTLESQYWKEQEPDEYIRVQRVVGFVLGVARQWFDYKLPKLLTAASELQAYVFRAESMRPGNYSYLSALLENSFFKGALSVLLDHDVPASAVRKIEGLVSASDDWTAIESKLRRANLRERGLLRYEIEKLRAALGSRKER
jgi:hypothetical protein